MAVKELKNTYLIVLSAPSGAGKTTLCKRVLEDFPSIRLSISSTTRAPRGTEKDGEDYFFLSRQKFEEQIQKGLFAEWASVHGNYYGTSRAVIENSFQAGLSVLLDIDVQGAAQLKKAFPEQCYRIFISPPNLQELEDRLRARGTETEDLIQRRLANAKLEMQESSKFDHVIINDDLERAYQELQNLVKDRLQLPLKRKANV